MDHFEESESAAGEGGQGIPTPPPGGKQEGTALNDTLAENGKRKGGRPWGAKDKGRRGRGRHDDGARKSEDRQVDRVQGKDLRSGFEQVQRRVLKELGRRTMTLEQLGKISFDELSIVFKVCRENIAAIDGQQAPSQEQQVVVGMPFEEEGEK